MRMADAGGDHVLVSRHVGVQGLVNIIRGLLQSGIELRGIGGSQIDEVHRLVQDSLNVLSGLVVLIHSGKRRKRNLQIIVDLGDQRIHLAHIDEKHELIVQGSRVGLKLYGKLLTCHGALPQQRLLVVHVHSLNGAAVDEQQKLGILGVVPLVDLGSDPHPHPLACKLLGHLVHRLEPIMAVGAVPVHGLAVKVLPLPVIGLRILRMNEIPLLVLPIRHRKLLFPLKLFQLVTDHIDPFV